MLLAANNQAVVIAGVRFKLMWKHINVSIALAHNESAMLCSSKGAGINPLLPQAGEGLGMRVCAMKHNFWCLTPLTLTLSRLRERG